LNERDAFKALFAFQQTLDGLDAKTVPNIDSAKFNVGELVHEVITRLAAEQGVPSADDDAPLASKGAA
jgi:chromosome partitioning protein